MNADVKKITKRSVHVQTSGWAHVTGCTNNMQLVKSCAGLRGHLP